MSNSVKHVPKKSVVIFTCKKCKLPQEVRGMSSKQECEYCYPIKRCAHGVRVTEACNDCWKVHHNYFLRVM